MNDQAQLQDKREKLLRLAVRASPSGLLIVDSNGNIIFANEALYEMFGYVVNELLAEPIEILVPKDEVESHRHYRKAYDGQPSTRKMGKAKYFEGVKKDGQRFPVEIGLRPEQTEEGRLVVATVIDITERKLIEDRLRRHEEDLEVLVSERTHELKAAQVEKEQIIDQLIQAEKMTAIGTLTSGIGHEINNPLYAILGKAEVIADAVDIALCNKYSREIIAHAKDIASVVKNFSGYAQPATKRELQEVDLNERIQAAVSMAESSMLTDDIEFRLITETVPQILAKTEEIQQVLFNIIRNGIQAINGEGVIEISSRHHDDQVTVRIHDSGKGIPRDLQGKIFDPFFTTKGPDEGEGLGLYVVAQIVAKYQGTLELDCDNGKGTAFVLQFPVVN